MATDIRYQPRSRAGGRAQVSDKPPQYMAASWKGVPFFCESSSDEFGRRGDLYEYPLSNRIAYKDMGKKAIRFKLEGYLIGAAQLQINLSREMAAKAQDPEPGYLQHPIHGRRRVACVTLTMSADFKKAKKVTKLTFEFVEAAASTAPYQASSGTADTVFNSGSNAVQASVLSATYGANDFSRLMNTGTTDKLASLINPPKGDEFALDAQNRLENKSIMLSPPTQSVMALPPTPVMMMAREALTRVPAYGPSSYTSQAYTSMSFARLASRIDYGAATIRRLHTDALERLKEFNAYVVQQTERDYTPSVQSLVMTTRLVIAREMAVVMMQRKYKTIKHALDDLDLICAIYDEEEEAATRRCDDVLVAAIRHARAVAIEVILLANIRLPGIVEAPTDGLWPSLVVAQKLYANGQRYEEIENYNPTMMPFWMGRHVVALAR